MAVLIGEALDGRRGAEEAAVRSGGLEEADAPLLGGWAEWGPVVAVAIDGAVRGAVVAALRLGGYEARVVPASPTSARQAATAAVAAVVYDVAALGPGEMGGFRPAPGAGRPALLAVATAEALANGGAAAVEAADDFLVPPFAPTEVLLRVRAALRRARSRQCPGPVLRSGALVVDLARHEATLHGERLSLTPTEFALLAYLLARMGRAVDRDELLRHVWGYTYAGNSNVVDAHIKGLRRKLQQKAARQHGGDDVPSSPAAGAALLVTVRGFGYRVADVPTPTACL